MLESLCKRIQSFHVDVIGRLVQRHHVRLCPHGRTKRQLGLLPLRKRPDHAIANQILSEAKLLKVLDDLPTCDRPLIHSDCLDRNSLIQRFDHTQHPHLAKLGHGLCGVLLHVAQAIPLHLVEDLFSFDVSPHQIPHFATMLSVLPPQFLAHGSFFFVRRLSEAFLQLLIPSVLETDLHVDIRSYLQVLLQMPSGVLCDVRQPQVAMLAHLPADTVHLAGNQFPAKDGHQRGLPCAIASHHRHPTVQRQLAGDIIQHQRTFISVTKANFLGFQDGSSETGDARELSGIWKKDSRVRPAHEGVHIVWLDSSNRQQRLDLLFAMHIASLLKR
mmetsp:Transcript_38754/g.93040  ORF Transcript_38754/g.93040 Transcript_38754/m.93040 type:complete len:330 (-) Transcript_38754:859-1848(-)